MKFRIEKEKDFIIFMIFLVFLMYLCAVAVVNFISFRDSMSFAGLNPFPAFSVENFKYTILLFFGALIFIFTSVAGTIFKKEKGKLGLSFGEKDEKGYSRWATDKEMKATKEVFKVEVKAQTAEAAGVPLINDGKVMYVDNSEQHTLVIGATASGKTTAVVNPLVISLAKKGESMIITDPKGEIYKEHCNMLKSKGYNVVVLNFRTPEKGSSWNPLSLPYKLYKENNSDKAIELLDDVARNIFIDPNNKNDPFWEKSAADYFAGICLGLFEDAKEKEVNINTISYMATIGEEKMGTSNYIKTYFTMKGEESTAYTFASNTINAPSDTKGSIMSVFRQKIRTFATKEDLSEMLSVTDFDIKKIGHEKTAIFLVIHDEKTTYHALATIFIKQVYETLIDAAYKEPPGKLPYRTNFILDEFANMPPLKDVTSMVTAARSRAIRFTFIIQNFAQLNQGYGDNDAETIKSNCGNMIYLLTTELKALEEISKLCGEVKSKDKEKTASVPLVTVADLQKMKMNEAIIRKTRVNPYKTKLTPSYKIDWGEKFEKAEFYDREKNKISMFDIREFVKEKKRNELFNSLKDDKNKPAGGAGGFGGPNDFNNPFNNPFSNPFGPSSSPFGPSANNNSFSGNSNPFGPPASSANPFAPANSNPFSPSSNPFSNPFDMPMTNNYNPGFENNMAKPSMGPKGEPANGLVNPINNKGLDLDQMVKKLDEEFAALQKGNTNNNPFIDNHNIAIPSVNENTIKEEIPKSESPNIKTPELTKENPVVIETNVHEKKSAPIKEETGIKKEAKVEIKTNNKPNINVDADSILINNNIASDDDFFDDFFADD